MFNVFSFGRKKLIYFLIIILCNYISLSGSALADTWSFPKREEFYSVDKAVRFTVIPSRDFDEFRVGPIAILELKNEAGEYEFLWITKLMNDRAPVRAVVSESGNYVLTLDDYHRAGYGDSTIVLYGKSGRKIANISLTDALSKEQIQRLPRSVSSVWWYCGSSVIDEGAKRAYIKIQPTRTGIDQCGEIVIDIESLSVSYLENAKSASNPDKNISSFLETASPMSATFMPSGVNEIREKRILELQKEISESPEIIKLIRSLDFKSRSSTETYNQSDYSKQKKNLYDEIIEAIKSGFDINEKDHQGKTALFYASGYEDIFLLLLKNGADPKINPDDWNDSFLNAGSSGRTRMVEAMIKAGVSLEYVGRYYGHTPLTNSMTFYFSHKSNDVLKLLLRHGADPNKKSKWEFPLDSAIQGNNWEGVDILLKAGADKYNLKKEHALFLSIHLKDSDSLKTLLEENFETRPGDYVYERAIILAVRTGYDEGIKLLVESGVSPDARIYLYGSTPLMEAAMRGSTGIIKNLIKMGADINETDDYGFSALDVALLFGQKESEKVLRENGAAGGVFTPYALSFLNNDIDKMKITEK